MDCHNDSQKSFPSPSRTNAKDDIMLFHTVYIELLPHGTNKGSGVEALRTLSSLSGRSIICVGDYWNDLEMLQRADVACVPLNGAEEVKALAHYITPDNNHDAIAYIIEKIIPGL